MSEISLPFSPSLLVYTCNLQIKTYVCLKGTTLTGSANYWRPHWYYNALPQKGLGDIHLRESVFWQVCLTVEVVSGRTSTTTPNFLRFLSHALFPDSLSASQLIRRPNRNSFPYPRLFSQSAQQWEGVYQGRIVWLAESLEVCRPMTECCDEVIMLVATSLAKQKEWNPFE